MIFKFFGSLKNFFNFSLVDTLDVAEILFGGHDDTGDGTVASTFEFGDIGSIDAALLELFDFEEGDVFYFLRNFFHFLFCDFFLSLGLFLLLHVKKVK